MKYFSYYRIKSKKYNVWSIRFFSHCCRLRTEKVNNKWRYNIQYLKLYELDLIPLYYEVGLLKYPIKEKNLIHQKNGDNNGHI